MSSDAIAEKISKIKVAHEAVRQAENDLYDLLDHLFPPGAAVRWRRGGRLQFGKVHGLGYGDSLFASNAKTGAIVKISVFDIIQAADQELVA